jgi:hypothetical protein
MNYHQALCECSHNLGAIALLSIRSAHFFQSPKVMTTITPAQRPEWIDVERPFHAFALSIAEAADFPSSCAIRRHVSGGGRKDILTLGETDSVSPYLEIEINRAGHEIGYFADPRATILTDAEKLAPINAVCKSRTQSQLLRPA